MGIYSKRHLLHTSCTPKYALALSIFARLLGLADRPFLHVHLKMTYIGSLTLYNLHSSVDDENIANGIPTRSRNQIVINIYF